MSVPTMTLQAARERVARSRIDQMSVSQRTEVLESWWDIGPDDAGWLGLPKTLRDEISSSDSLVGGYAARHNPLLLLPLLEETRGVRASWLEAEVVQLGEVVQVVGDPVELDECSCCRYLTIEMGEAGWYDICRVCGWENDGTRRSDTYSGVNHMTLREGKCNFAQMGARSASAKQRVVADPTGMYERGCGERDPVSDTFGREEEDDP